MMTVDDWLWTSQAMALTLVFVTWVMLLLIQLPGVLEYFAGCGVVVWCH